MHPVLEEPVAMLSFLWIHKKRSGTPFVQICSLGRIVYLVLFGLALYVPVNSYGHAGMIS